MSTDLYLKVVLPHKFIILFHFVPDQIEGLHDLWPVGDNFVATMYREHFIKRRISWYMWDNFEFGVFCKSRFCSNNTNILSRLRNSVIQAINARVKLPKIMVILIERDFIEALQMDGKYVTISASLYGTWVEWLAQEIAMAFKTQHDALPVKAKCSQGETIIYWSAVPSHKNYSFELRAQIAKFNNCLESVLKLYNNMRLIKIKKDWDYDNVNLVNVHGRLTHQGIDQVCEAVDASVKFNFSKRTEFLAKSAVSQNMTVKQEADLTQGVFKLQAGNDPMTAFFKRKKIQDMHDKCLWSRSVQRREDPRYLQSQRRNNSCNNRFMLPRIR